MLGSSDDLDETVLAETLTHVVQIRIARQAEWRIDNSPDRLHCPGEPAKRPRHLNRQPIRTTSELGNASITFYNCRRHLSYSSITSDREQRSRSTARALNPYSRFTSYCGITN
jgi:hypothetical protein